MYFFSIFLACSQTEKTSNTDLDPSLFDQTCSIDSDCMTVVKGDACGCNCRGAAINISQQEEWQKYYQEAYAACDPAMMPDCAECYRSEAFCEAGTCRSRPQESE